MRLFRQRVPFVAQMTASECSVACLAMVLAHHGRKVPRSRLRAALALGRDGVSAHDLLQAARTFGLVGRGLRRQPGNVQGLATGSILHWNSKHFVVLERTAREHAWILDPAIGRRRVDLATLKQSFSGLALELSIDPLAAREELPAVEPSPSWQVIRRSALQPGFLVPMLLGALVSTTAGIAIALVMAEVIARLTAPEPRFGEIAAAIAVIGLTTVAVRAWRERRLHCFGAALERELGHGLMAQLLRLPLTFYRHRSTPDLVARLSSVQALSQHVARAVGSVLTDGPMVVAYLVVLFSWNVPMGVAAVAVVAAYVGMSAILRRARESGVQTVLREDGEVRRFEAQLLAQIESIKAAGSELAIQERWDRLQSGAALAANQGARQHAIGIGALDGIIALIPLTLLAVGGYEVVRGGLSLPAMIGINCLATALLRPFDAVITAADSLASSRHALDRIDDVMLEPIAAHDAAGVSIHIPGRLELIDVMVRGEGRPALEGISLVIEPVRHISILGAAGAGKSALAAVIAGVMHPDSGRIAIDGHDLARIALSDRPTCLVLPSVELLDGCIYDNIALSGTAGSDEAVEAACRIAGIHEEIQALPRAYRVAVADGGKSLPVGMRRRILIARALFQGAPLLVLDGAAAALGARAEGTLLDAILARPKQMVITVSEHRSTTERADFVIVLDRGRLVDAGSPSELQARCPMYRELTMLETSGRVTAVIDPVREAV